MTIELNSKNHHLNQLQVRRLTDKPIISNRHFAKTGDNVNGPSLIRVPDWIDNPLGTYYLYFAHHNGKYIRLAYANRLTGPWTIYTQGVLPLEQTCFKGHVASPDVHVDHDERKIRMYFHGSDAETDLATPQYTCVANSPDGLRFDADTRYLGRSYWRLFHLDDFWYALEMPGTFYRARRPSGPFETGPVLFNASMRHSAVLLVNRVLHVFYSNVGDCPESILHVSIDVNSDWRNWKTSHVQTVISPLTRTEGASLKIEPSVRGIAEEPVCELRDPAVYVEDGHYYILYSVAGEQGISIAELILPANQK